MNASVDSTPALTVCEIAFVADGERYQAQIPLRQESIQTLSGQVEKVEEELRQFSGQVIKGFSFLWEVSDVIDSSASELYETLHGAVGYDEDVDWEGFKTAAEALDQHVLLEPQSRYPAVVEFVWENGGDDDNLFTQGFVGLRGSPLQAEVEKHLEFMEEVGLFYDLGIQEHAPVAVGENQLEPLLDWSKNHPQLPVLANFLKQAKSFEANVLLDEQLPAVSSSRRGPRF